MVDNESSPTDQESMVSSLASESEIDGQDPDHEMNKILTSHFDVGDALQMDGNASRMNPEQSTDLEASPVVDNIESHDGAQRQDIETSSEAHSVKSIDSKAHLYEGQIGQHRIQEIKSSNNCTESLSRNSTRRSKSQHNEDNQSIVQRVYTNQTTGKLDLPPDGGYGWVSLVCVFLTMFSSWGCNSSFGVFLAFYLNNDTFPGASKYDYALIAGLPVFIGQVLCPIVTVIMKVIGIKPTMLIGVTISFAGFLLASFATKLWHLYVTQGMMIGISIAFVFIPATTIIPGWFLKKRAVAMGLSLSATGVGGVVYGLSVNKLIQDDHETKWALRMLCIVTTITLLLAITFIKQAFPTKPLGIRSFTVIRNEFVKMFKVNLLEKPFIALIAFWFTFALFGYNLMIFTLSSYAVARGLSSHDGSTLTAVLNACQAIGRPMLGLLGDRYGRTNITTLFTVIILILLFAFWITAHTFLQLLFFVIMLGSCVGVANVMSTVLIADMVGPTDFLPAWSFVNYAGSGMFLVCEVIAQALVDEQNVSNPYIHTQIFAGLCFVVALILVLLLRQINVTQKMEQIRKNIVIKLNEYESEVSDDDYEEQKLMVAEKQKLLEDKAHYDQHLESGIKAFFVRMTYPMKV
ncbi:hypothetical protein TPHA_0I01450 [Tetrapisispora phaffii CBS 4417]|uniref:Major facilitator superfamily (MFS) profile domain-containing protein n=1 Tax=Tetrapisispora phaffii (strain ATCC 24235 / CBS 4417 / NBRC 1672 / NRRL Y-8282 / UCD 70-5) TaxID=1071381 RepID=G8BXM3_TETPH|nr:hypothetical protein TPHA_0I01450 [Tetrapisispora phaffii CBS 4417]CCE64651.1 hypothetical protein TPHA_0I01450 [Tetrapisispora phaffii CBS 4417]